MDRITAEKSIARNLRDLVIDTVPASLTASSIDATALIQPVTDQLQGRDFYAYSGAASGQQRSITSFNVANKRIFFSNPLASLPSTNTNFLVFQYWKKDEYDNALDRAIGIAQLKYLQDYVATISIIGTQYEYTVPSGFEFINNLRLVPSGGATPYSDYEADDLANRVFELPQRYWHIEMNPLGSYMLTFDPRMMRMDNFDGDTMRIRGQAKPNIGTTDTSAIPDDITEYIINAASMLLASNRIDEGNEWRSKFGIFRDRTRELEDYIYRPRRGKPVA